MSNRTSPNSNPASPARGAVRGHQLVRSDLAAARDEDSRAAARMLVFVLLYALAVLAGVVVVVRVVV